MPKLQMNLENLPEIKGGMVDLMLRRALQRMALDIASAPDLTDWRSVTLKIKAKPVLEQLELSHVVVEFEVGMRQPTRVTSANMLVAQDEGGQHQLYFALDSEENPNQQTIHDVLDQEDSDR